MTPERAQLMLSLDHSQFFLGTNGKWYADPTLMPSDVDCIGACGCHLLPTNDARRGRRVGGPTTEAGVIFYEYVSARSRALAERFDLRRQQ